MKERIINSAWWIILLCCAVLAIELRLKLVDFQSSDFEMYTSHWMQFLRQNGPFYSFADRFSNYSPAYIHILSMNLWLHLKDLFFIKYISFLFEISAAIAVYRLVKLKFTDERICATAVILFLCLPTVLINSAQWAQCDIIYTSFVLWSFYFLLVSRTLLSMVLIGVAFAFKLQTIFIFPFYFLVALHQKVKLHHLALLLLPFLLSLVPSYLAGRNAMELLGIYFSQDMDKDLHLSINCPNVYTFFNVPEERFNFFKGAGIFVTALFTILFMLITWKKRLLDHKENFLPILLFFSLLVPFLLPRMHERYFFMAEVLSLVYLFYNRRKWFIPLLLQVITINTYFNYLYGFYLFPIVYSAILMTITILYLVWVIYFKKIQAG